MVEPRSSVVFSEIAGPGIINSLWLTTFPTSEAEDLELASKVLLNIYWDHSESPAVSVPLSDFFCQSQKLQEIQNHFFHATNNQLLFTSTIPMPFRKMVRFQVSNPLEKAFELFYGIDLEFKEVAADALYLHTHWQQSIDLPSDAPFTVLPETSGQGRYLGTHLSLRQQNPLPGWPWYTRPMTVFLDTKTRKEPALHIKTLDDFFGSGWWDREPEHNTYAYPFIGRPLVETDQDGGLRIALYKYHVNDPWWFHESIRLEIGENWNWGNQHISPGDWTTTAFFYLKVAE